jgi:hypothetical protein
VSSAAVSGPQIATDRQDGRDDFTALLLGFLSTLPPYVTAVEVEGWRMTRA